MARLDTFKTKKTLTVDGKEYTYFDLKALGDTEVGDMSKLPYSLKVILENMLRFEDGRTVIKEDVLALKDWLAHKKTDHEIAYRPARVLMQDFTGVPAVVDLAAMRDGIKSLGGDPQKINPLVPVDLVIDHSVMVDFFGTDAAFEKNVEMEFGRNQERYEFLRWGSRAFENFRVVPPGTGICHQVNLEYLGQVAWSSEQDGELTVYPDTLVGTDSHTTMINGLGVLGWGVGGIEAEAAMLGQPISMLIPEVIGFKLTGALSEGVTATDLVLTVTEMLRAHGVVGKFVEFYGDGVGQLSLADRATLGNMSPEFGSTCAIFPVDQETLNYLEFTGRDPHTVKLVEAYAKAQGMWREDMPDPVFTETLSLDISTVEASLAGPKRPQDRVPVKAAHTMFIEGPEKDMPSKAPSAKVEGADYELDNGDVVIAAITSCTNTSNPTVMLAAGLVAKKAREKGLSVKPWVKTSLAPGSQVVTDYLEQSSLQDDLDALGFNLVGYGCTTCIGNSGPLPEPIQKAVEEGDLCVTSVLSGNRNFEGRVNPHTKANYLASPPLVVAYAIAGNMKVDLFNDSLGKDGDGNDVYLKDIWPSNAELKEVLSTALTPEMFKARYANVFEGPKEWQAIQTEGTQTYNWSDSTYIANPPYFEGMNMIAGETDDILSARPLAILGDSVTTDHISPAGNIAVDSPAGKYLREIGVNVRDFNSYGARRGNHEVMMRGTFANIRLQNEMTPETKGSSTKLMPSAERMSIFDASMQYQETGTPLIVIAGKEYGTGSSRDWAAKGTRLLGVKAVIAESFERIHRSNLIGMGVIPLQFKDGVDRHTLKLDGTETFDLKGISGALQPKQDVILTITRSNGDQEGVTLLCRLDTVDEVDYYKNGGILHMVLRQLAA